MHDDSREAIQMIPGDVRRACRCCAAVSAARRSAIPSASVRSSLPPCTAGDHLEILHAKDIPNTWPEHKGKEWLVDHHESSPCELASFGEAYSGQSRQRRQDGSHDCCSAMALQLDHILACEADFLVSFEGSICISSPREPPVAGLKLDLASWLSV